MRTADLLHFQVDYLLAANERLLRNQELLQQSLGDRANALEANERELVRRVEDRLRDLIQCADRSSTLSPALIRADEPDIWTVTTRRGGFSRSEQADWAADLRAFKVRPPFLERNGVRPRQLIRSSFTARGGGNRDGPFASARAQFRPITDRRAETPRAGESETRRYTVFVRTLAGPFSLSTLRRRAGVGGTGACPGYP